MSRRWIYDARQVLAAGDDLSPAAFVYVPAGGLALLLQLLPWSTFGNSWMLDDLPLSLAQVDELKALSDSIFWSLTADMERQAELLESLEYIRSKIP